MIDVARSKSSTSDDSASMALSSVSVVSNSLLLRRFRPPVAATVELTEARPSFLVSSLGQGEVTVVRRPFWSNGDWWAPDAWAHEEWDVQIGSGLYRLRHVPEGWFVDGIYD